MIERRFAQLETAAHGGPTDGRLSGEDLVAALAATTDPELAAAVLRVGLDAIAFRVLDRGGHPGRAGDGTISRKDMARVRTRGIEGVDFSEFLGAAASVQSRLADFDTAAHGGEGDGRFAMSDLRAALRAETLSPDAGAAAQLLLAHDDLLELVDGYAPRKRALLMRIGRGLLKPAARMLAFTTAEGMVVSLIVDPKGTLLFPFRVAAGFVGAVEGTATGLLALGIEAHALGVLALPGEHHAIAAEWRRLAATVTFIGRHPSSTIEALIDIDGLEDDPDRWLGQMALGVFSGDLARSLQVEQMALVRMANTQAFAVAAAAMSVKDGREWEQRRRGIDARAAALRAALTARWLQATRANLVEPAVTSHRDVHRDSPPVLSIQ